MARGAYEINIEACLDSQEKIRECLSCTKPRCNNCESETMREKSVIGTDGDGAQLRFPSLTAAAKALCTHPSNIRRALKSGSTAKGLRWKYEVNLT